MKPISISAEALFEEHQPSLRWEWIAGHAHPERRFDEAAKRLAAAATSVVTLCWIILVVVIGHMSKNSVLIPPSSCSLTPRFSGVTPALRRL